MGRTTLPVDKCAKPIPRNKQFTITVAVDNPIMTDIDKDPVFLISLTVTVDNTKQICPYVFR